MRARAEYRIGPGMTSLLLIFMVLCLATLAILTYAGARIDTQLTQRNQETATAYYQASARVQQRLFALDTQLEELRTAALGDVQRYREQVEASLGEPVQTGEGQTLRVALEEQVDERRVLAVEVDVYEHLEGPRYVLRRYAVEHTDEWAGDQNIGYYVPADRD